MDEQQVAVLLQESHAVIKKQENMIATLFGENKELKGENRELKEEASTWNRIKESPDQIDMSSAAKTLCIPQITGRNKMFEFLRDIGWLRQNNEPYQRFVDAGYFKIVEEEFNDGYGNSRIYLKTVVFQAGLQAIHKAWDKFGEEWLRGRDA